jgi:flagellar biosynthesis/type III secretory pathway M-ring protein FliF/YscJ
MKPVLDGFRALGPARLMALGVVGLGMLVMLGLLAVRGGVPAQQALLYGDLDLREASQMADVLDHAHIAHTTRRTWPAPVCCLPRMGCPPVGPSATKFSIAATL